VKENIKHLNNTLPFSQIELVICFVSTYEASFSSVFALPEIKYRHFIIQDILMHVKENVEDAKT